MQSSPTIPTPGIGEADGADGAGRETAYPASETGPLEMACLGRTFHLGSLYDCRTESVIPGLGLWTQSSLDQLVQTSEKPCSKAKLIAEDSMQTKAHTLNVAAELKVSLLGGLISVSGAGKYLNDKATSKHQSRVTVNYHCTSREERLIMEHLTKLDFKEEILEMNLEATHVVTAILYGANAVMVFDKHHESREEKQKVEGELKGVMKKFVDISGSVDMQMTDEEKDVSESLTCTFYGDFKPKINPTSYKEAMSLWRELPEFLDEKKHVPIRVWLYPINKLFNRTTRILLSINVALIERLVEQMDRADNCVAQANDLLKSLTFRSFKSLARKAQKFLDALSAFTSLVKQELQRLLPSIRSGSQREQMLFDLMSAWDASPFALSRLDSWLSDYQALDVMITKYLNMFRKKENSIREALEEGSIEAAMLDLDCDCVVIYYFHMNSQDKQLSDMAEKVQKSDIKDNSSFQTKTSDSLQVHKIASKSMMLPTRTFINFAQCNSENDKLKFLFTENLETCSQTHCSISVYRDGQEVEKEHCPPSATSKPQVKYEKKEMMEVYWEAPKHGQENVDHYKVLFSSGSPVNWALSEEISTEVCSVELPRQSKDAVYHVKVETWGKYGKTACSEQGKFVDPGTGADDERVLSLRQKELLQKRQIQKDKSLCDSELKTEGIPSVYLLQMKEEHADHSRRLRRLSYGPNDSKKAMKTILVVGATGAGKSTLINAFANHLLGVDFEDNYRFRIVKEDPDANQAVSQTKWVTAYVFYHQDTFPNEFPCSLTIVDTPGFGDTSGIEEDEKIKEQLSHFFHATGVAGLDSLDAIGFVVQSSLARLTPTQKYIFHSILALFGKDIAENIFILATFADGQTPPVIAAADADKLPYTKYFKFNNSALFAAPDAKDEYSFDKIFWKMGVSSYDTFLTHVSQAKTKSLTLTNEVLDERDRLQAKISDLQIKIKMACNKSENLQAALDCFLAHQTEIERNTDFEYTVTEQKIVAVKLERGVFVTNCLKCNQTCHYPCGIADNDLKWGCAAMSGTIVQTCTVCVSGCGWRQHKNTPERFEIAEETVTKTVSQMKAEYETACKKQLSTEDVMVQIIEDIERADTEIVTLVEDVRKSLERLSEIALRPDYMTTAEYIDVLIKSEKQQAQRGWQQRVKQLESVRERAELIKKYAKYHGISEPFQALKKEIIEMKAERKAGRQKQGGLLQSIKNFGNMVLSFAR